MAIMKLTAFNAGLRGKISGTIFQSSPFGQVAKSKGVSNGGLKLTKADAGRVIPIKKNITNLATAWRSLSSADRATWVTGAVNFPAKNKFGDSYTPSGFQVYMSLNMNLLNVGLTACPSPGVVGNAPAFTVTSSGSYFMINIPTFSTLSGYTFTLYCTRSISLGAVSQKSMYKALYVFQSGDTFPFNLGSFFTDIFGTKPGTGNFWFKLTSVNNATGQVGLPYVVQCIY